MSANVLDEVEGEAKIHERGMLECLLRHARRGEIVEMHEDVRAVLVEVEEPEVIRRVEELQSSLLLLLSLLQHFRLLRRHTLTDSRRR